MRATLIVAGLGILMLFGMVVVFANPPALLEQTEYELLDWRFRTRGSVPPKSPVTIVAIDDPSIDALGRWPWSRNVIASLIDQLTAMGAVAIGLDVTFSEPEVVASLGPLLRAYEVVQADESAHRDLLALLEQSLAEADTDALLERAIGSSQRTVLGYFFRTGSEDPSSAGALEILREPLRKSRIGISRLPADSRAPLLECSGVEPNLERFHDVAARAGFFTVPRDPDGVVRRAPLIARCQEALYPALSLAVLEAATGQRSMVLGDATGMQTVRLAGESFPTDPGGRILLNYRGPAGTFPRHSVRDVLEGRTPPDAFEGRIVLVGPTAVGIGDTVATPFDRVAPGVTVHATAIDNLLAGDVLRHDDRLVVVELLVVIVLGLIVAIGVPLLGRAARGALLALGLGAAYTGIAAWAFTSHGIWINMAFPLTTLGVVYLVTAVANGVVVERAGRVIRRQFSAYVPPEVVQEMTDHPELFKLGGELRELSILFSDVRGFTTLAQKLGAENTAHLMNVYLTEMTGLIHATRGTLDKYIGDAVVAFWGAPLPVDDHPTKVCEAAIAMQRVTAEMRERAELPGASELRLGIGIHTDEVVVGNLGSEQRFAYTMTGDGVNLCSRLEGLTKYYGVEIIASRELTERIDEGFLLRELDSVKVVGRTTPVTMFEIVGRRDPTPAERARHADYAEGLAAFRDGRFKDAASCFERIDGEDGPTQLMLDRIRQADHRPPDGWEGVWTFDAK